MQYKIADTGAERQQARELINEIFPQFQHILRKDRDLISVGNWDLLLQDPFKELWIVSDRDIVRSAALLDFQEKENGYVSYLVRHPMLPTGSGMEFLKNVECRAKAAHSKKRMIVSTVFHSECPQEGLEKLYLREGYRYFMKRSASREEQQAWEPEYRNAQFKFFEKDL